MRFAIAVAILFLAASFPFVLALSAHAVSYSNDTNSVDIDYQGPAPIGAPDTNIPEDEEGDNGGGGGSDGGGGGGGETPTSGGSGDTEEVTVNVSAGGQTDGTSGSAEESGTGTSSSGTGISGEDILNSLFGNQALSTSGGESSYALRLNGKKAREALKARGITKLDIVNRFTSKFLSKKDFALGAVSDILNNENIEEVILSLNSVQVTYRSQGRLFAVFPMAFPVTVTVNPYADTAEARVFVKFPWYSFFLQKFVSKDVLIRDINAAVDKAEITEADSIDARTRFLNAITQTIASRVDTVEGTLQQ